MTAFSDDPVLAEVTRQTDSLLDVARRLTDEQVRAPSLLTGWTRGHVLTHLARNADACTRLLSGAAVGEQRPMYLQSPSRDEEIEAGAHRSAADQEADLYASGERLLAACAALPEEALGFQVRHRAGQLVPISDVPWMRWQELVLHQADLDIGYELPDGDLAARCLTDTVDRFAEADPPPAVRLEATDMDGRWQLGEGGPVVTATTGRLLRWLGGRSAGAGLSRYPDGVELPSLPAWR